MVMKRVLVTYTPADDERAVFTENLKELARVDFLSGKPESERNKLLSSAEIIVAQSFSQKEVDPVEVRHLKNLRFIQLVFAGADSVPYDHIPDNIPIASNPGAFAQSLAEHVLALTLALAKNLFPKHTLLAEGRFDRSDLNKAVKGAVCGIIGFGGNGKEIAKLMRAVGMKVYAVNRSGQTNVDVDFIGTPQDLEKVLAESDVVVLATPLTRETRNLVGSGELEQMKADAILINVARGDVVDQGALYEHLKAHPQFQAGIDTWWSEPDSHGEFRIEYPFFELPNLIGSPHNADDVPGQMRKATEMAVENVKKFILEKDMKGVIDRGDYLF
jgi:glycerate dehydrogenase